MKNHIRAGRVPYGARTGETKFPQEWGRAGMEDGVGIMGRSYCHP